MSDSYSNPVLDIKGLRTSFYTDDGEIPAVDHIDIQIHKGEILGIVGESGCGKSVTSLSVMGLIPSPPGRIIGGNILFNGENLLDASEKRMRSIRGNEIAMIFQEPMTSLNPLFKIGNQLIEALRTHRKWSHATYKERAIEMLNLVGLPRAEELLHAYPHQLSGGMRQRVMIAMAMICDPKLLIADEPTTALDVTIQKQILRLMRKLNETMETSIMLITHDLGVVAEVCDRIAVMYAGKIVEQSDAKTIFADPKHPYTKGLLASVPDIRSKTNRLFSIPGNVPKPGSIKRGCRFAERCQYAMDHCFEQDPDLYSFNNGKHQVRCFLYEKEGESAHESTITSS
ncbi:ABC transporter ATP-binding protein [Pontibacillus yanchengensis]|uniref:Peptide ABC transporter ATP-binding protein n=1 Tax=Pontibacillus yanchengensis Y32 TaxID=1385514 RepID=A0A0A2TCX6_9BACI|nr:ABC transporter ATP-binding protein [Pontibacillus yanchengensis]KGP73702.1 peptide ABC transporter ATP-binding protein [Pontibacillus yanchengensis Y32]